MLNEEISDKIKALWAKYSNEYPKEKTNLIDQIFSKIYDVLNNLDPTFISVEDYMSKGMDKDEKKN